MLYKKKPLEKLQKGNKRNRWLDAIRPDFQYVNINFYQAFFIQWKSRFLLGLFYMVEVLPLIRLFLLLGLFCIVKALPFLYSRSPTLFYIVEACFFYIIEIAESKRPIFSAQQKQQKIEGLDIILDDFKQIDLDK